MRSATAVLLAPAMLLLPATAAKAEEEPASAPEAAAPDTQPAPPPRPEGRGHPGVGNWLANPDGLTGSWGGARKRLHERGITPYATALAELASNVDGGRERGSGVATQLNGGVLFDMEPLAGWKGGKVRVEFAYRDGVNLSASRVGNLFEVQETFGGGRIARLAEVSVEQSFAGGAASLKAGRVFAGADFAFSPLFCAFQTNATCGHPNSIPYNSGISLYPVATWGARLEVKPTRETYVRAGVFEVNASLNGKNGFDWSTRNATGVFLPAEIGYHTELGNNRPGLLRVGGYVDTSDTPDNFRDVAGGSRALSGLAARERSGRWGLYAIAEQKLTSAGLGGTRGWSAFVAGTVSDRETAYFDWFVQAGLVKTGTFAGRDEDTISLGGARGHVSPGRADFQRDAGLPVQGAETVLEVNYNLQVNPWLSLRPGLQYVIRPGAADEWPDATVLGFQTIVHF